MNRRIFLSKLIKASITIAVTPSILAEASKLEASKQILTFNFDGHEYWFDWAMFEAERKWHEELDKRYWKERYKF